MGKWADEDAEMDRWTGKRVQGGGQADERMGADNRWIGR